MGEVVKFPGSTTGFPSSEEDLMEKWTQTRMMYCDELVNTFFSKFASQLSQVGFPLDDKTFFLKYITAGEMMSLMTIISMMIMAIPKKVLTLRRNNF
jgi:hypothetical protein